MIVLLDLIQLAGYVGIGAGMARFALGDWEW